MIYGQKKKRRGEEDKAEQNKTKQRRCYKGFTGRILRYAHVTFTASFFLWKEQLTVP